MKNSKYYEIRNKYLADGLAFLDFRYKKVGYGKDKKYLFEDTERIRKVIGKLLDIRREI